MSKKAVKPATPDAEQMFQALMQYLSNIMKEMAQEQSRFSDKEGIITNTLALLLLESLPKPPQAQHIFNTLLVMFVMGYFVGNGRHNPDEIFSGAGVDAKALYEWLEKSE